MKTPFEQSRIMGTMIYFYDYEFMYSDDTVGSPRHRPPPNIETTENQSGFGNCESENNAENKTMGALNNSVCHDVRGFVLLYLVKS